MQIHAKNLATIYKYKTTEIPIVATHMFIRMLNLFLCSSHSWFKCLLSMKLTCLTIKSNWIDEVFQKRKWIFLMKSNIKWTNWFFFSCFKSSLRKVWETQIRASADISFSTFSTPNCCHTSIELPSGPTARLLTRMANRAKKWKHYFLLLPELLLFLFPPKFIFHWFLRNIISTKSKQCAKNYFLIYM